LGSYVSATDIHKDYRRGTVTIPVLRGVSLGITRGEFVSVVGRSGSGKSTLLNLLGGLDTPTSGRIVVGDRDVTAMTRHGLAMHRRSTVGMIFQSFNLISSRTAAENITLALAFGGWDRRARQARAMELLSSVGLSHRVDHRPGELSGGEAQRVAIARALANDPAVLLADEPTGNLDSGTADEILSLLRSLNADRGLTVVMVTHDEEAAGRISHRLLRLFDGLVADEIRTGTPQ
jgi:putative ABC transport system ATP-binding protein